jgi:hypothetical protein
LLERIRDYGWYFVCRLKKNRRFNGQPLRAYRRHPSWAECGWFTGGLTVLVVRYSATYYASNRLTLRAAEVRRLYQFRAQIEEVISVCKDHLLKLRADAIHPTPLGSRQHETIGGEVRGAVSDNQDCQPAGQPASLRPLGVAPIRTK